MTMEDGMSGRYMLCSAVQPCTGLTHLTILNITLNLTALSYRKLSQNICVPLPLIVRLTEVKALQ